MRFVRFGQEMRKTEFAGDGKQKLYEEDDDFLQKMCFDPSFPWFRSNGCFPLGMDEWRADTSLS
jgi:hypothetical protein